MGWIYCLTWGLARAEVVGRGSLWSFGSRRRFWMFLVLDVFCQLIVILEWLLASVCILKGRNSWVVCKKHNHPGPFSSKLQNWSCFGMVYISLNDPWQKAICKELPTRGSKSDNLNSTLVLLNLCLAGYSFPADSWALGESGCDFFGCQGSWIFSKNEPRETSRICVHLFVQTLNKCIWYIASPSLCIVLNFTWSALLY